MSVETVNQFLEKVGQDEKLQQELTKVLETQNNDRDGVKELGAKYGYQFTPDEFWQEIQHRQSEFLQRQQQGDLSDEELEAVAGGDLNPGAGVHFKITVVVPNNFSSKGTNSSPRGQQP